MKRRKNSSAEAQVRRISQMTERHKNTYSQISAELEKACQAGDVVEIERITKKFNQISEQFMAEIDAEAKIINQELHS